jgi:hypothetical protein
MERRTFTREFKLEAVRLICPLVDPLARPLGRPASPNPVPQNFLHGRLMTSSAIRKHSAARRRYSSAAMRSAPMPEGLAPHQGKKFPRLKRATVRFETGQLRRPRDRAHHSRGRYNRAYTYRHARTLGIEPRKPVGPPRMRGLGQLWCRT